MVITPATSRTDEIENELNDIDFDLEIGPSYYLGRLFSAVKRESQEDGSLDFLRQFENVTIYKMDGVYYNSHEGLNYLWGSALDKLGIPSVIAVKAANEYHKSAYERDVKSGVTDKYQRVGPNNESNYNKAWLMGYYIPLINLNWLKIFNIILFVLSCR